MSQLHHYHRLYHSILTFATHDGGMTWRCFPYLAFPTMLGDVSYAQHLQMALNQSAKPWKLAVFIFTSQVSSWSACFLRYSNSPRPRQRHCGDLTRGAQVHGHRCNNDSSPVQAIDFVRENEIPPNGC